MTNEGETMTVYENLPAGTYLRDEQGHFIRVISMQGTMAYCERVKRDGSRDRRTRGWSGSLPVERWHPAALRRSSRGEPCKQSLDEAQRDPAIVRALNGLVGCPSGGWPETRQAFARLADEAPQSDRRAYSITGLIDAAMVVDSAERYQWR